MRISFRPALLSIAFILAFTAWFEVTSGRLWMCKCGTIKLWHGDIWSSENSQHIADWYALSHIIHGFIFFGLTWLLLRKLPMIWRLNVALLIEAAWEMFENSAFIIDRYRSVTVSLDYYGDSVVNSLSDLGFMALGFYLASKFAWRWILAAAVAMELLTFYLIRDGLVLNVLMLVHPIEAIKKWQAGQ